MKHPEKDEPDADGDTQTPIGSENGGADPQAAFRRLSRANTLCAKLGLPAGWFLGLLSHDNTETDWSFCIKIAAVAEDATKEALENFPAPNAFTKLARNLEQARRIALLKELKALDATAVDGLLAIARVRNRYAHTIRNVHMSLQEMLSGTQANHEALNLLVASYVPERGDTPMDVKPFTLRNPRVMMWSALLRALDQLYFAPAPASK